jgi:ferredoxin-thioredoxin reductase catalytic subunit
MFKKIKNQLKKKDVIVAPDNTVLDEVLNNLDEARKSEGFLICMSWLYNENGEERLRHHVFKNKFKKDDVSPSLEEYKKLSLDDARDKSEAIINDKSSK